MHEPSAGTRTAPSIGPARTATAPTASKASCESKESRSAPNPLTWVRHERLGLAGHVRPSERHLCHRNSAVCGTPASPIGAAENTRFRIHPGGPRLSSELAVLHAHLGSEARRNVERVAPGGASPLAAQAPTP